MDFTNIGVETEICKIRNANDVISWRNKLIENGINTADGLFLKVTNNEFATFMRLLLNEGVITLNYKNSPVINYTKNGLEYFGLEVDNTKIHIYTDKL